VKSSLTEGLPGAEKGRPEGSKCDRSGDQRYVILGPSHGRKVPLTTLMSNAYSGQLRPRCDLVRFGTEWIQFSYTVDKC
jgi:hypothetical protein